MGECTHRCRLHQDDRKTFIEFNARTHKKVLLQHDRDPRRTLRLGFEDPTVLVGEDNRASASAKTHSTHLHSHHTETGDSTAVPEPQNALLSRSSSGLKTPLFSSVPVHTSHAHFHRGAVV